MEAIIADHFWIDDVAPHLIPSVFTEERCIQYCQKRFEFVTRIPSEYRTEKLLIGIVQMSYEAAMFCLQNLCQTEAICVEAVHIEPYLLCHIKPQHLTSGSYARVIKAAIEKERSIQQERQESDKEHFRYTPILTDIKKDYLTASDYDTILLSAESLHQNIKLVNC